MKKKLPIKKKKKDKPRPKFDVHNEAIKAWWAVVLVILFFLSTRAFVGQAGAAGSMFHEITSSLFGLGRFVIPFVFLAASYILFGSGRRNSYIPLIIGGALFFSGILGIFNIFSREGSMAGGYLGYFVSMPFIKSLGNAASVVIFVGLIFASVIISFNIRVKKVIETFKNRREGRNGDLIKSEDSKNKAMQKSKSRKRQIKGTLPSVTRLK